MHIRLIDTNALGYAHHHGQPVRTDAQGHPVQAVAGVLNHARQQVQGTPDVLNVFVWDGRAQWRYDLHAGYKSGRHRTPEQQQSRQEYAWQQPWIKKALGLLPVLQVTHPLAEADDVAWGLAKQLSKQGHLVTLSTSDSDWLQSVEKRVRWQNVRSPHQVVELEGFTKSSGGFWSPGSVAQVKALAGDTSDDIEGVPGIADKRALGLLSKYKTLDALLAAAQEFLEFSSEPAYAHGLMLPEVRALVARNLQLVDLAHAPALAGRDCLLTAGEGSELDLYEMFVDLKFLEWQDYFAPWKKLSDKKPDLGAVLTIERAVASISDSWKPPG